MINNSVKKHLAIIHNQGGWLLAQQKTTKSVSEIEKFSMKVSIRQHKHQPGPWSPSSKNSGVLASA